MSTIKSLLFAAAVSAFVGFFFYVGAQAETVLYIKAMEAWQRHLDFEAAKCHVGKDGLEHCHQ